MTFIGFYMLFIELISKGWKPVAYLYQEGAIIQYHWK